MVAVLAGAHDRDAAGSEIARFGEGWQLVGQFLAVKQRGPALSFLRAKHGCVTRVAVTPDGVFVVTAHMRGEDRFAFAALVECGQTPVRHGEQNRRVERAPKPRVVDLPHLEHTRVGAGLGQAAERGQREEMISPRVLQPRAVVLDAFGDLFDNAAFRVDCIVCQFSVTGSQGRAADGRVAET